MDQLIQQHEPEFKKIVDHLKDDLATLRVGRANPLLVENILVDAYGTKTPLKQMASITVPAARTMIIAPWDKTVVKEVEKAIAAANIGISPVNEGEQIRLSIPQLTEESRRELVKSVAEKLEKARIGLRQIRDKVKEEVVKQEKAKAITQDDRYSLVEKLDELIKKYNEEVKSIGSRKEAEIMEL